MSLRCLWPACVRTNTSFQPNPSLRPRTRPRTPTQPHASAATYVKYVIPTQSGGPPTRTHPHAYAPTRLSRNVRKIRHSNPIRGSAHAHARTRLRTHTSQPHTHAPHAAKHVKYVIPTQSIGPPTPTLRFSSQRMRPSLCSAAVCAKHT